MIRRDVVISDLDDGFVWLGNVPQTSIVKSSGREPSREELEKAEREFEELVYNVDGLPF